MSLTITGVLSVTVVMSAVSVIIWKGLTIIMYKRILKLCSTLILLITLTGCSVIVVGFGAKPPKFHNGQEVQTVENKYRVTVIGTACDVRSDQQEFESCRYLVRLNFKGRRTLMFEESELEEIK